ncbi:DUF305 domain-containing protein [Clostridium sp. Marseille-P2415]|uniref:DUF305 domain-containing protein n=1 Tax=Clostridium sp. Marseille-P2415 TaxID=1805471 RepID=UPI00098893AC|nr:DUF305 domain-containing protein [Clostridium sp. Marseille-P2415]
MKKNLRYWAIGFILAFTVLLVATFTSVNWIKIRKSNQSKIPSESVQGAVSTVSVTPGANPSVEVNRNLDNVSAEDNVNRYLSRQDEIMTDMMQAMKNIPKSGNASIDFLNGMVLHHESAILMSEAYLSYGSSDDKLKGMAEHIIPAQQAEITRMQDLADKYGSEGHNNEDKESAYLEDYHGFLNRGQKMDKSNASSLGHAFADGMIKHHQMAVEMAKSILEYTDYEEIRTLAQNIITVQEQEINEMRDFTQ